MYDLKVRDVMTHLVVSFRPGDSVQEAASRLSRNNISGGPVLSGGKVVGVVSEADLIRAIMPPVPIEHGASILDMISMLARAKPRHHDHGKSVGEVMNTIVLTASPDDSIWQAASVMERRGIKRLPVVDTDGSLLGIISRADLIKSMARSDATIRRDVESAMEMLGAETIDELEIDVVGGVVTLDGTADRRSTHELAVGLAARVPGVVEIIDHIDHATDDGKHRHTNPKIDPRENWNSDIAVIEGRR